MPRVERLEPNRGNVVFPKFPDPSTAAGGLEYAAPARVVDIFDPDGLIEQVRALSLELAGGDPAASNFHGNAYAEWRSDYLEGEAGYFGSEEE